MRHFTTKKEYPLSIVLFITLTVLLMSIAVSAKPHLEVGAMGTSTTVLDDCFEFFASDYMVLGSYGFDLRVEVAEVKERLHLLPFVTYRYGNSYGAPMITDDYMDTSLDVHDLDVGLRVRSWFLPWLGGYVQLYTGLSHIKMKGEIDQYEEGMHYLYEDSKNKWNLGGTFGVELRFSPALLKKHNITRFNFGGELGVGFVKRGQTNFTPTLDGGDEFSLNDVQTVNFGDIDLSGVVFQFGFNFSFF